MMRRSSPPLALFLRTDSARRRRVILARALGGLGGLAGGTLVRPILPALPALADDTRTAGATASSQAPDWDVPGGHFYTQAAGTIGGDRGFVVSDAGDVRFWRDYRALGGPAQIGFPVSSRFDAGGTFYQAMEAGLLRWDADVQLTVVYPVFLAMTEMDLDGWLEAHGVPRTAPELLADPALPPKVRLTWLTHPILRAAYLAPDEAAGEARLGPPMSAPQRFGPYVAQRFEKAVLQLWLDKVDGAPAPGTVSMVPVGELLKEARLIPDEALAPQPAPAPRPPAETPKPVAVSAGAPLDDDGDGKRVVVSLGKQWWYAYERGKLLNSGPVTTGQPDLPTPVGRFTVLSRHSPYTMISPWPPGNKYWYAPSNMTFALRITNNGVFLHDAPWRPYYGPGTNVPHYDPDGVYRTGSHGCINLPYNAAAWLWNFAPTGTVVDVTS